MEPIRQRPPRDSKPTMLINEISKLFRDQMREYSEKLGFQPGYRQMLMHLAHEDGITQVDLVRLSHFKAPTVSVTLKKMEAEGLVRRETDANDQRQTRVYLTEKGHALDDAHFERLVEVENIMLTGLTKEDEETLLQYLKHIRNNILAYSEGRTAQAEEVKK